MKKIFFSALVPVTLIFACNKSTSDTPTVSLTASTTTATVGQTVAVTASTNSNTLSWTATPATTATLTYKVSTEKTNYFTFSKPGNYVVGVRTRGLELDSIHVCNHIDSIGHHLPDSLWNHHIDSLWHNKGHDKGDCKNGLDSASIIINVK